MNKTTTFLAVIAAAGAFALSGCDESDDTSAFRDSDNTLDSDTSDLSADNTGNNSDDIGRDLGRNAMTPIDQSEDSEHIETTAEIRRAIMDDDSLSSSAKNSKIITDESGRVWLRGVVDSQAERDTIEMIASRIAGDDAVTNELVIEDD